MHPDVVSDQPGDLPEVRDAPRREGIGRWRRRAAWPLDGGLRRFVGQRLTLPDKFRQKPPANSGGMNARRGRGVRFGYWLS